MCRPSLSRDPLLRLVSDLFLLALCLAVMFGAARPLLADSRPRIVQFNDLVAQQKYDEALAIAREEIADPFDWNEVTITANGPAIEININGVTTAAFTETLDVPSSGGICLQAHAGGPYEVWYQDIVLTQLEQ